MEAFADGELGSAEMRAFDEHTRQCASCAADLLGAVRLKLAIRNAGRRYSPSAELRQSVLKDVRAKSGRHWKLQWAWAPALAAALAVLGLFFYVQQAEYAQRRSFAELADVHVATLASSSPVDVVSIDRHTVKPWFAGKIPFTFNLPELAGTPFVLEGGRIAYLGQSPGAQLLFKDGNHRISVFIFQNRSEGARGLGQGSSKQVTFNLSTWSEQGLRYVMISDVEPADLKELRNLLSAAAKP